jgi:hypothetical protein
LDRSGDEFELHIGCLDAPDQVTPTFESWVVRREAWLAPFDVATRYERDGTTEGAALEREGMWRDCEPTKNGDESGAADCGDALDTSRDAPRDLGHVARVGAGCESNASVHSGPLHR